MYLFQLSKRNPLYRDDEYYHFRIKKFTHFYPPQLNAIGEIYV